MTDHTPQYGSAAMKNADGEVVAYGPYPQCLVRNGWGAPDTAGPLTLQQENQGLIRV